MEDLQRIVGEEHAWEAASEDAVDGIHPSFVAEPSSIDEASELMKLADSEGLSVAPRGSGTKMLLGNPPSRLDLVVSTARVNEVIEHVPGDQIIRVQAGLKLETLQEQLAGSEQILGIDPPEKGATIGGTIATNSSGPRRLRYGTIRDLIIGITVVLADGTVAKAGGKVVKNVAGYDLSKLFTGSLGTIGLIATANFRLHPRPELGRTVAVELSDTKEAGEATQAVMHSQIVSSALELHWNEDTRLLTLLIEGIPPAVEAQAETASFLFKPFGETRTLRDEEIRYLGPLTPPDVSEAKEEVALKIGAPPTELAGVLDSVLGACERSGVTPSIIGHAANGITMVGLSGGGEEAQVRVIEELRGEIWVRRGGSLVVQKAPLSIKKRVDVWGPAGDYLGLIRRVKGKFDPRGVLNPGRFLGGI
ncbi:MAG: FAD-binding oxidoreductase [Rubrobacter sp.]|nr:FAD-binding oxidoreductase [Rubrobacter sp.]